MRFVRKWFRLYALRDQTAVMTPLTRHCKIKITASGDKHVLRSKLSVIICHFQRISVHKYTVWTSLGFVWFTVTSVTLSFSPFLFPRLHAHIKEASPRLSLILRPLRISLMTLQLAFSQCTPEIASSQPVPNHCAWLVVVSQKLQDRSQPMAPHWPTSPPLMFVGNIDGFWKASKKDPEGVEQGNSFRLTRPGRKTHWTWAKLISSSR